jgi:hypothetical protein
MRGGTLDMNGDGERPSLVEFPAHHCSLGRENAIVVKCIIWSSDIPLRAKASATWD